MEEMEEFAHPPGEHVLLEKRKGAGWGVWRLWGGQLQPGCALQHAADLITWRAFVGFPCSASQHCGWRCEAAVSRRSQLLMVTFPQL